MKIHQLHLILTRFIRIDWVFGNPGCGVMASINADRFLQRFIDWQSHWASTPLVLSGLNEDGDALSTLSPTFSGLPGIIRAAACTLNWMCPCDASRGRLISHNALSWWDNEKWPEQATRQYRGWRCTHGPRFLFNPVFFKMIALVTFSLPVCQLDTAIFPLSSLSCSVSFILKRHFTHGWL